MSSWRPHCGGGGGGPDGGAPSGSHAGQTRKYVSLCRVSRRFTGFYGDTRLIPAIPTGPWCRRCGGGGNVGPGPRGPRAMGVRYTGHDVHAAPKLPTVHWGLSALWPVAASVELSTRSLLPHSNAAPTFPPRLGAGSPADVEFRPMEIFRRQSSKPSGCCGNVTLRCCA